MTQFDEAKYAAWRSTVRWTDEEIAQALDAMASRIDNAWLVGKYRRLAGYARGGRVSVVMVRLVVGELVKTCVVCGKTALYRSGDTGMCRAHKSYVEPHAAARRRRLQTAGAWRQADQDVRDRQDGITRALRRTCRNPHARFK